MRLPGYDGWLEVPHADQGRKLGEFERWCERNDLDVYSDEAWRQWEREQ